MKQLTFLIVVVVAALNLPGCLSTPLNGSIYTNTEQSTTWAEADGIGSILGLIYPSQTNTPVRTGPLGSASVAKRGEHCSSTWFPKNLFWVDLGPSLETAMEEGGISRLAIVDRRSVGVLTFIYMKECIVAYGE